MENGEHDIHPGHDASGLDDDQNGNSSSNGSINNGNVGTNPRPRRGGAGVISVQTISSSRGDQQQHHQQQQQQLHHMPSPVSSGNRPLDRTLVPPDNGQGTSANQSSRNSPEPVQTDRQGHYVGPSSGASFLLRIQRKLQQHPSAFSSDTSIFTFGDLPLPESDPRFLILPPRSEAEGLVRRYFEFASATHRFLHRPTVELWLQELYETQGTMGEEVSGRSKTALLFMVFASASNFPKSSAGKVDPAIR